MTYIADHSWPPPGYASDHVNSISNVVWDKELQDILLPCQDIKFTEGKLMEMDWNWTNAYMSNRTESD